MKYRQSGGRGRGYGSDGTTDWRVKGIDVCDETVGKKRIVECMEGKDCDQMQTEGE